MHQKLASSPSREAKTKKGTQNNSMKTVKDSVKQANTLTLIILALIVIGIISTVVLVGRQQELPGQAVDPVELSFEIPGSDTVEFGQTFTAYVKMNTNSHEVSAADVSVNLDPQMFEVLDITKGNFFDAQSAKFGALSATDFEGRGKTIDNVNGLARLAVGIPCDPCRIGNENNTTYPLCPSNPPATCYYTSSNDSGFPIQLTLRAKDKMGPSQLTYNTNSTKVSGKNSDSNIAGALNPAALTVILSCQAADVDKQGTSNNVIQAGDIQQVANRFNLKGDPSITGNQNGYDRIYDYNKDGVITTADIQQVANRFNFKCN